MKWLTGARLGRLLGVAAVATVGVLHALDVPLPLGLGELLQDLGTKLSGSS